MSDWGLMNKAKKGSPDVEETRLRQQAIGARLRQIFDDVVNEPVPDDFLDILRRAETPGDGSAVAGRRRGSEDESI
jgi:urease accessory protein UreF